MNNLHLRANRDTTSAAGAMFARRAGGPILVGLILVGLGTTTEVALARDPAILSPTIADRTTSGVASEIQPLSGSAINELRRLTKLTWEQLARLFGVSRRSLHFWASGKPMASSNEEHLQRVLAIVRKMDRGTASANRALLLSAQKDGGIHLDALAATQYERVLASLGGVDSSRLSPRRLTKRAGMTHDASGPDDLVGALQDRIHRDDGRIRVAKSARVRGGRAE